MSGLCLPGWPPSPVLSVPSLHATCLEPRPEVASAAPGNLLGLGIISGAPGACWSQSLVTCTAESHGGLETPRPTVQDGWGLLQRIVLCRGCGTRGLSPG